MPYFKTSNINILLIHIPKTGGSSVEYYFSKKFGIPLNQKSLYERLSPEIIEKNKLTINSSLQHMTFQTILNNNNYFNIDFNNNINELEIITIVRNPYERIISDLFFMGRIFQHNTNEEIFVKMQIYLNSSNVNTDNHNLPQHVFIKDNTNNMIPNIKILKTETLNKEMYSLGFTDFNLVVNPNRYGKINYYDYLNNDSIKLINDFYDEDFRLFGYEKKIV